MTLIRSAGRSMSCLSPAKEYAHVPSTIKRILKKYFGTRAFCHMSEDVRIIRCQIAQVQQYNILYSWGNCMLKNIVQLVLMSNIIYTLTKVKHHLIYFINIL